MAEINTEMREIEVYAHPYTHVAGTISVPKNVRGRKNIREYLEKKLERYPVL